MRNFKEKMSSNTYQFLGVCCNGELETAKWIWSLGDVDHHFGDEYAFRYACYFDHLETAKWVWSLGGVNHHAEFDEAFRDACVHGHLDVAKWLWSLGGVDHRNADEYDEDDECNCQIASEVGNFEIAKWLFFLDDKLHNKIPNGLLNEVLRVNVFESTQISLIDMYTKLIIS